MDAAPRRLKVIHLVTMLELGGAQGNTIHTVRSLDRARFDAHLWCGSGGYWDRSVEADLGTGGRLRFLRHLVRPVSPLHDLLAVLELWRAIKEANPDIVHTHSSKAGIVGRIAARLAGVPTLIHTFHGFGFNDRQPALVRWLYVALEKWVARFSRQLLFVSEANRAQAARLGIGTPGQYALVRSGVPLKRLAEVRRGLDPAKERNRHGIPGDGPVVVTVSAFKPQKNLGDFLEIAMKVAAAVPGSRFVLIGDGAERPRLESMARRLGISDVVHMPGWLPDASPLMAAADVFVLTSLWEGLPRALVEAIALGVPAVCYKTDGVSDLLREEREVRPRGDIAGMASAVVNLLKDRAFSARLAATQSSRLSPDFDIDEMVRRQESLYLDSAARPS